MASGTLGALIRVGGFAPLLATLFLGALNDNLFKIVVALLAANLALEAGGGSGTLALAGALFVLPYLLFSGYAGYLADAFSKRRVLIAAKVFEIVAMGLGLVAFLSGRVETMLAVLFVMATQSAFFSPAKYGILPEFLPDRELSRANGLVEMATFLAIILGTTAGSLLFDYWSDRLAWIALVMIAIAVAGTLASLGIARVPPPRARKRFSLFPWAEVGRGVAQIYRDRALWLTVLAISYFWFLGALLQLDVILLGKEVMALGESEIGAMQAVIAIGIAAGSLAAGRLSGDKVELGLVPIGSIGIGMSALLLAAAPPSFALACAALVLLGFFGGLFIVPLNAFLQQRAGEADRGRLIASNNVLNMVGILLASGVLWLLHDLLALGADGIVLAVGVLTFAATAYILTILPDFLVRFVLWLLAHSVYRIRVVGQENLPFRGPALLVCNHMSFVDGLIVGACVQRFVRFMVHKTFYEMRAFNWLFRRMGMIAVADAKPREIVRTLQRAREALLDGQVVCIFAEGAISRTGNLLPFRRGIEKILDGLEVPVIPVHLDGLWGSIFSFKGGRFFWKWPERLPYPVTVSFGAALPATAPASAVREAVQELGSEAIAYRFGPDDVLPLRFLRTAKRHWRSPCAIDAGGGRVTFGQALVRSLTIARRLRRSLPPGEMVGVALPPSVDGLVASAALALAGKVPVMLGPAWVAGEIAVAVKESGLRAAIVPTDPGFPADALDGAGAATLPLEEIERKVSWLARRLTGLAVWLLPARVLAALYRSGEAPPDAPAAVGFSSGTTGARKGVVLSHLGILASVESAAQVLWITGDDRVVGVLPYWHPLGLTGTLWLPLIAGCAAVYPTAGDDARAVGEAVARHGGTILITTPGLARTYLEGCGAGSLAGLRYALAGGEPVGRPLAEAFRARFGVDLLEGYGCAEMGAVIALNVADVDHGREHQTGARADAAGHPLPGIAVRIVDTRTGASLPLGETGRLVVKGPGRMIGYLSGGTARPADLRDGWFGTDDLARLDEDGFIWLAGRAG